MDTMKHERHSELRLLCLASLTPSQFHVATCRSGRERPARKRAST